MTVEFNYKKLITHRNFEKVYDLCLNFCLSNIIYLNIWVKRFLLYLIRRKANFRGRSRFNLHFWIENNDVWLLFDNAILILSHQIVKCGHFSHWLIKKLNSNGPQNRPKLMLQNLIKYKITLSTHSNSYSSGPEVKHWTQSLLVTGSSP